MRIGIDARLWNESGVGRYIRNLVKHLQIIDLKNEYVLFILAKDRNEILNQVQNEKGKVQNDNFRILNTVVSWHTIEEQIKLPALLNKYNLDLVHFPYVSIPFFYNKPFVVTIHDLIPYHFPTGEASTLPMPLYKLKLLGYKFVISQAAKRAKKVIAVSNATKKEIVDHLGVDSDKVAVTYEGANNEITNPKSQIPNNSQNTKYKILNTRYFLYVGNAYPHKNLERLLEAFTLFCHPDQAQPDSGSQLGGDSSQASPDQNDTKLVLVGKEDYFYRRLKEKVKDIRLEGSVVFYGEASDRELSVMYKNALALIMPSLMEGFGLPALEAMANKCLVLASNIDSLKEICGESALYFDSYSANDMYHKMKEIHFNDINHYSDNIKVGFEKAKIFSWEKMARETLKIYEEMTLNPQV